MSWLRPAALYLTLTALVGGSIWLFWGKAIEQKWKQLSAEAAKVESKKAKPAGKAPPVQSTLEKKSIRVTKATPRDEWQKAQSGFIALVSIEAADNRSQLAKLAEFNDNRWHELLRRPRLAVPQPSKQKVK